MAFLSQEKGFETFQPVSDLSTQLCHCVLAMKKRFMVWSESKRHKSIGWSANPILKAYQKWL